VREVLEGYLDDDQDMKDMNITAKEQHALQVSCWHSGKGMTYHALCQVYQTNHPTPSLA
jgi:hypothetical protein